MLGIKRNRDDDENSDIKKFKKDNNIVSFEKKNLKKTINITSFSGRRVLKNIKDTTSSSTSSSSISNKYIFDDLLKKPINEILKEIEDIESLKLKSKLLQNNNKDDKVEITNTKVVDLKKDNRLWVDKYSPTSFHDLLSDSTMNLEILNWLELWDTTVFNKPLKKNLVMPASVMSNTINNNNANVNAANKYNNKVNLNNNQQQQQGKQQQQQYLLQEDGTPIIKIILLSGGPGLGKTTLAHVLAKHAKYNPVEINASEDRSGEAFESKLLSAIEMKSMFNDKRPNCLIIDEIDGISGRDNGPIELLIKLIDNSLKLGNNPKSTKKTTTTPTTTTNDSKKSKSTTNSNESDDESDDNDDDELDYNNTTKKTTSKSKKKKEFSSRILRPIICICNDQYVPSLRRLRQKAMVFNFQAPKKNELLSRLKFICSNENLITSDSTLTSLIDMTGSDIRSCINSLQFIKSKTNVLNSDVLKNKSNIVIGQKDIEKGLFEIWGNLFKSSSSLVSTNNSKKGTSSSNGTNNEHFNQLDFQINSCNQIDKLIEGIHENYLTNMSSDFSMEKTVDCLDWMIYNDQLVNSHTVHDERYRTIVPLAIHQRGCTTFTPKIILPHSEYDSFIKKKSISNIKDSFYTDLPALVYSYLTKKSFHIDFVYPFVDILSLPVRVSNTQLYSVKEKLNLNQLVEIMKLYKLSYKLEKSTIGNKAQQQQDHNSMQYKLEPPIDTLLFFRNQQQLPSTTNNNNKSSSSTASTSSSSQVKHIRLSNSQKQIISIAIQQYKPLAKQNITVTKKEDDEKQQQQTEEKPTQSKHQKDLFKQPQPIKPLAPTILKDFFGRVIQTSPETKRKQQQSENSSSNNSGPNIKYRFQEGFTNAVKKTVYVKDFF